MGELFNFFHASIFIDTNASPGLSNNCPVARYKGKEEMEMEGDL